MHFFEKRLRTTDVKKQMAIPTKFIRNLPLYEGGHTIYFPVHDVSGYVWENFGYYIRKEGQPYRKPIFQGGWRNYVDAKSITPGDKIIFRVEESAAAGAPRYTIAAKRKIILLGKIIGWSEEF
ncbi:hypothetical protein PTKIN_Ptkin14bG0164600 [Pterospermum kingtungense]